MIVNYIVEELKKKKKKRKVKTIADETIIKFEEML